MKFKLQDNIPFSLHEKMRNRQTVPLIKLLEETQYYEKSKLSEFQWIKAKKLLTHAYKNISYYKKLWDELNINPTKFSSLNDLEQLPVLSKSEINVLFNELKNQPYDKTAIYNVTSGSTGRQLNFYMDKTSQSFSYATQYRGLLWWDILPLDKQARIWGEPLKFSLKHSIVKFHDYFITNKLWINVFNLSPQVIDKYLKKILFYKPVFFYGYVSGVYNIAQHILDKKTDVSKLKLKGIVTTSEILYPYQKEIIEKAFNCPVINEYGAGECGIIAYQCPEGNMHLMEENLYIEYENSSSDENLKKIIITNLNNYAMPFIRYDVGDYVSPLSEPCKCGRTLKLIDKIQGRSCDTVVSNNGSLFHAEIFDYLARDFKKINEGKIDHFQVTQKSKFDFEFKIVQNTNITKNGFQFIESKIKQLLGEKTKVHFTFVDHIPLEKSGKLRYFISEIKPNNTKAI